MKSFQTWFAETAWPSIRNSWMNFQPALAGLAIILLLIVVGLFSRCLTLERQLGREEMKALALAEAYDKPQPAATTVTSSADGYEKKRLQEAVHELDQRVKELKRACDLRDAIIGTYQQRELGRTEEARAEFHRALQLANTYNFGVWPLEYKVPSNLWNLAGPRFKIYRDKNWGLTAKEVRFASTK